MSSESSEKESSWIAWFCGLEDHQIYCAVDEEFLKDQFNLYGLKRQFASYDLALQMILESDAPLDEDYDSPSFMNTYQEAIDLYGLVHARFILTPKGLQMMREKFVKGVFGNCPRVLCNGQYVLPIGVCDQIRKSRVKLYCPLCQEVYAPKSKCRDVDGGYFGTSFPHVLLQNFPELQPKAKRVRFAPRIFGFQVQGKDGSKYQTKENELYQTYRNPPQKESLSSK